jgi:hypothetical protein
VSAPVFITAAAISAELHQAMLEARGLALTAKNARALAVRAGSRTVGFRAITDFIEELASTIIRQSQNINVLAEHLSQQAVNAWRADMASKHFDWVCTQNSRYQNSLTVSIDECKAKQLALSIELQKGISLLTDQLEESRKQIRTANLIATSSHVEASSAGEFRRQLEVIADTIRATAGQIGAHLTKATALLSQSNKGRRA